MPKFIYFDLGNVLVNFDPAIACRQVADVVQSDPATVQRVMYDSGLEVRLEAGEISEPQFLDELFAGLERTASRDDVLTAMSAMFSVNVSIIPIASRLVSTGIPMGILSNTCAPHWNWILSQNFGITRTIGGPAALSYEIGHMKPAAEIYKAAADMAKTAPNEILFIDDRSENVQGAVDSGWNAIQYSSTDRLVRDLRAAGMNCFI